VNVFRVVSFMASRLALICSLRLSASRLAAWILSAISLEADMVWRGNNNNTKIHYKRGRGRRNEELQRHRRAATGEGEGKGTWCCIFVVLLAKDVAKAVLR